MKENRPADQNDMVVNLTKTKEMIFDPPSITSNLPPISASSYQIQRATEAKLLGVLVLRPLSERQFSDCIF